MSTVKFQDNSEKILRQFKTASGKALNLIGSQAQRHTADNTPVRTGNLREHASWEVEESEKSVIVGFEYDPDPERDPFYAIYVEEGSQTNIAQHMLRRAITENSDEYKSIAEQVFRNA